MLVLEGPAETVRISVPAPDAPKAFDLEKRLRHLHATAIARDASWQVELDGEEARIDEVVAVVRNWLADEHLRETTVRVDGRVRRVHARS